MFSLIYFSCSDCFSKCINYFKCIFIKKCFFLNNVIYFGTHIHTHIDIVYAHFVCFINVSDIFMSILLVLHGTLKSLLQWKLFLTYNNFSAYMCVCFVCTKLLYIAISLFVTTKIMHRATVKIIQFDGVYLRFLECIQKQCVNKSL